MTCPVVALETWLRLAHIAYGPPFRRVTGKSKATGAERLHDQEVARGGSGAPIAASNRL
jgi:hypothetical protein